MTPSKPKFVTYYRVSTERQGRSGLGLEAQQQAAQQHVARMGGIELATFTEIESGKVNDRPQLEAALLRCRQTRSILLVAKLDRLSRNAAFLLNLRDRLMMANLEFRALDIPDSNALMLGVMAALAQHERETISKRTKDALAARKARGLSLGTPRDLSAYQPQAAQLGAAVNHAKAQERAQEIYLPAIDEARQQGNTSLRQIAAYLNAQGIQTPRGKQWTATAVANANRLIQSVDS